MLRDVDVLVVGAGPVGLLSALLLLRRGLSIEIVDQEWRPGAHSYALALHPASLRLLRRTGLIDELLAAGRRIDTIAFYDQAVRCGQASFGALGGDHPHVLVLRQDVLEGLLDRALRERQVPVRWNHSVSSLDARADHVEVAVDQLGRSSGGYAVANSDWTVERQHTVRAQFVIGADGHRSTVRNALGIGFPAVGETRRFAVFEFTCPEVPAEMCLVVDDASTNVLWPMPAGRCRWSFELTDPLPAVPRFKSRLAVQIGSRGYPALSRGDMETLIRQRAPWFNAPAGEMHWSMAVQFERRLAERFGRGRIWLAGDAAHLAGPAGVQSMNVGLREADDLVARLAQVLRHGADVESVEGYDRARQDEWRRLLGPQARLTPTPQTDAWLRRRADRLLECLPASGEELAALARQLALTW